MSLAGINKEKQTKWLHSNGTTISQMKRCWDFFMCWIKSQKEKKTWNSAFGLAINRGSFERHISAAMSHASLAFSTLWKMDKK
jgi:hypothetical protein